MELFFFSLSRRLRCYSPHYSRVSKWRLQTREKGDEEVKITYANLCFVCTSVLFLHRVYCKQKRVSASGKVNCASDPLCPVACQSFSITLTSSRQKIHNGLRHVRPLTGEASIRGRRGRVTSGGTDAEVQPVRPSLTAGFSFCARPKSH